MDGDIATLKDIHGAYVRGSVPTAEQESDDILNQPFSDERDGADSSSRMPNAYITGTVITADAEAKDITSFVASTHSRARPEADQDVAHTEQLLQLPHERTLTKLSMQGDIATMKDIHAAYVRGSVATFAQESDDILNQTFFDEPNGPDSASKMPSAYVTGTVTTADAEARDITSFAASTHSRDNMDVAHTEQLLQAPLQSRAKAWLTELGMQGDIPTLKDIHAAYVRGSVPTSAQESDDILNQTFGDEKIKKMDLAHAEQLLQLPHERTLTKLSMQGDIATMKDIHAAYVRGSVATFAQESDDILNQTFFDEPNGPDSASKMPSAYVTGTVTTADAEARDITSFAASTHSRDNKDVAHTEQLLQLPRRPTLTKLNMQGDIATMKDIHGAFVRGSVPTAQQESDDILNQPFSDERDGADSSSRMPNAYVTGTVVTADAEARDITSFAASTKSRTDD
jgi:hypothetical protein